MNRLLIISIIHIFSISTAMPQETDTISTATRSETITKTTTANISPIDKYACSLSGKYKSIPKLAADITAPYTTDSTKVRAIFIWICNNIAYDCKEYHNKNRKINGPLIRSTDDKFERAAKWADIYYKYANKVLKNRKGVCEGYASLFYELCKANGIKCEVVTGKVKKEKNGKIRYYGHAWNKVYINEQWYYLDATWAAGYCDEKVTKYYKDLSEKYYLTPIDEPYNTHIENEKQTKRRNELVGNW